jgi:tetratricopeptide (TPR) repeat protein
MTRLYVKLGEKYSVPDLRENLEQCAKKRRQSFDEQHRKLYQSTVLLEIHERMHKRLAKGESDQGLLEFVRKTVESRKEKPWWVWASEALTELDLAEKDRIYARAIEAFPNDATLLERYALFLHKDRTDLERADHFYQLAIEADSTNRKLLTFYANFLSRKFPDRAEEYYRLALKADPSDSYVLSQYAGFLYDVRKNPDKAEEVFVHALEACPTDEFILVEYEEFLRSVLGNLAKADEIKHRIEALQ